ncbi:hypothetical protein D4R30_00960 [archaeon]|nr:MAG: hypothetical protein D4R30_00960 [archaeon]
MIKMIGVEASRVGVLISSIKLLQDLFRLELRAKVGDVLAGSKDLLPKAFILVVFIGVVFYSANAPVNEDRLIPRLTTDKEVYFVGEAVHAEFSYFNPYSYLVAFSPPSQLPGLSCSYMGEGNNVSCVAHISWAKMRFTVSPGGSFRVFDEVFMTSREGDFVVSCGGLRVFVKVVSPSP